jgi:alanyl-tRNA synthetase
MPIANEVRQQFIDFFCKKHGHTFVPSSPVVPLDDPTLLFANAGMNQFKPYFLGTEKPPYPRAANTQKCIRAGGKHNDLDDVGKDTYHHTFFEMLGNWSFGDYFKKEAIAWAWELLTEVWQLDKSRLHVTVFEGDPDNNVPRDDEAAEHWRAVGVDPAHIHLGSKKDNFWEMGETGPCGPCTEIHIDRTPDKSGAKLVNQGTPDVIEIWNLVFIQFNRNADKSLTPLPAKHVDTGMGFERITAVLQGKTSNYDTDVFTPIMDAIGQLTGNKYGGRLDDLVDIGFRVIADHLRMATFAITDGARPGNKKRDAVLRSVIRRAVRFGYQYFDRREPFLCNLVNVIVEQMGTAFPELTRNPSAVSKILRDEESEFFKTIQRGMKYFEAAVQRAQTTGAPDGQTARVITGKDAFDLHTTYGFSIDLTMQMALELGLGVDMDEYQRLWGIHTTQPEGTEISAVTAIQGDLPPTDDSIKYKALTAKAKIVAWVKDNLVGSGGKLGVGDEVGLVLNKTNFYAEQGGQVGDKGWIRTKTGSFEVTDTQRLGDAVLHLGRVHEGTIKVGQTATLEVSGIRADTMRNHTATHLLNWALRKVLGEHVEQKGSLVDASKTRFDFAHDQPLTPEQVGEVERLVNEKIYADLPVTPVTMPLEEAKKVAGVRAVFGEKYPDPVRVLLIGAKKPAEATLENSVEFCGGTHLTHTGEAGFFKIVSQELVGKGVRRVTAVTGKEAVATVQRLSGLVDDLTNRFRCRPEDLPTRIDALQDEIKKLQKQLQKGAATDLAGAADKLLASATQVNGSHVIVGEMPAGPDDQLRNQIDRIKQKAGSAVVLVGWVNEDKVGLLAAATDDLVKKGVHAGKLVGEVAKLVGGGGGGRPNMAQAGGKEPAKLGEALQAGKQLAEAQLSE